MKTLVSLITILILAGCGSSTPFERGPKKGAKEAEPATETSAGLSEKIYMEKVFPQLERDCTVCHGNPAPDFNRARSLVVFRQPELSPIYMRPSGHDHETVWAAGTPELTLVTKWIMGEAVP